MKRLLLSGLVLLCILCISPGTTSAKHFDQSLILLNSNVDPYAPPSAASMDAILDELCEAYPNSTSAQWQLMYNQGRMTIKTMIKDELYHIEISGVNLVCLNIVD